MMKSDTIEINTGLYGIKPLLVVQHIVMSCVNSYSGKAPMLGAVGRDTWTMIPGMTDCDCMLKRRRFVNCTMRMNAMNNAEVRMYVPTKYKMMLDIDVEMNSNGEVVICCGNIREMDSVVEVALSHFSAAAANMKDKIAKRAKPAGCEVRFVLKRMMKDTLAVDISSLDELSVDDDRVYIDVATLPRVYDFEHVGKFGYSVVEADVSHSEMLDILDAVIDKKNVSTSMFAKPESDLIKIEARRVREAEMKQIVDMKLKDVSEQLKERLLSSLHQACLDSDGYIKSIFTGLNDGHN